MTIDLIVSIISGLTADLLGDGIRDVIHRVRARRGRRSTVCSTQGS